MHRIFDKFDKELFVDDYVDVQLAGVYQIFEHDGELCFKPYEKTERVVDYFRNDIIYVEPERGKKMSLVKEYAEIVFTEERFVESTRIVMEMMIQNMFEACGQKVEKHEVDKLTNKICEVYRKRYPEHLEAFKQVASQIYSENEIKVLFDFFKDNSSIYDKMQKFSQESMRVHEALGKEVQPELNKIMDDFFEERESQKLID